MMNLKYNSMNKEYQQIETLSNIINFLEDIELDNNENITFNGKVKLYGIINYSRVQYFPQVSSFITGNPTYSDIFFNYTSVESMILDLFMVIESDLILVLEDTEKEYDYTKLEKIITFSIKLLKILEKILENKYESLSDNISKDEYNTSLNKYTNELFNVQNEFYNIVYDEKIDFRVK